MPYLSKDNVVQFFEEKINELDIPVRKIYTLTNELNALPSINFITCDNCRFHLDCEIERLLTTDIQFCSHGKPKI